MRLRASHPPPCHFANCKTRDSKTARENAAASRELRRARNDYAASLRHFTPRHWQDAQPSLTRIRSPRPQSAPWEPGLFRVCKKLHLVCKIYRWCVKSALLFLCWRSGLRYLRKRGDSRPFCLPLNFPALYFVVAGGAACFQLSLALPPFLSQPLSSLLPGPFLGGKLFVVDAVP